MKNFYFLVGALLTSFSTLSQNVVEVNASDNWVGFMNVFNLAGGYEFGSTWGVADLRTDVDVPANQISLHPNYNTYADNPTDPFWVNQTTGAGEKVCEASTYVEPGATFNENELTFSGEVISNTLSADYTAKFFIKALDPNDNYQDALGGSKVFDLPACGVFSVTASDIELAAGLIVQYGFSIKGPNTNPADEATNGKIVIGGQCNLDVTTSTNGATITANAAGSTYRWLNCDNNLAVIAGESGQSFTPSANGSYAVEITNCVCVDTSDCVAISTVGLEAEDFSFNIYPNPVTDNLYINVNGSYETFKIFNATGQSVKSGDAVSTINLQAIPRGIYFLQLNTSDSVLTRKFIKK